MFCCEELGLKQQCYLITTSLLFDVFSVLSYSFHFYSHNNTGEESKQALSPLF